LSAKLLKLWAYFDREDVWFELLRQCSFTEYNWIKKPTDFDWVGRLTEDELSFNEAVRLLCNYGLVDPDTATHEQVGSRGYSMHSCVHSWTVFALNKKWDESLARLALHCIASAIPSTDTERWWMLQRRLFQHTVRCKHSLESGKLKSGDIDWALHKLGDLYRNQSKLAEAEAMFKRTLQGIEEALGPKHMSTLDTVVNTKPQANSLRKLKKLLSFKR
jgi:hypothetical protein